MPMSKQSLIILIFIAVTAWIGWQYFMPAFNATMSLRQTLGEWQVKLENTRELSRKLDQLRQKYDSLTSEADKISQVVTKKEDIPGLLVQLESLSSQNGLILESATFNVADAKKNKPAQTTTAEGNAPVGAGAASGEAAIGAKTLAVDLSLSGSQSSLMTFLKAIENNLRIMDVSAIDFSLSGEASPAGQDFKVSLNTYYRE